LRNVKISYNYYKFYKYGELKNGRN